MFNKSTLKNGLTLVTAPKPGTAAVTVLVLLPVGSRYETRNINGVSHFIEHMMFKGTDKRPTSLDISKELDAVGAEFNAFTAKDHTGYYVKIAAEKVELAFDILSDIIFHSKFDAAELEKERGVIVEEINMYEDNPLIYIENLFEQTIFGNHPLGRLISGPAEVIKAVKHEQITKFLKAHYLPANLHLTVAGNFSENKIRELAETYFNHQAKKSVTKKFIQYQTKQNHPRLNLHYKATQQVQLCLGFPSYSYFHPDIYALELLSIIFGGNMSSRLFIEVREKYGLAYFIKASANVYQDVGTFFVQAGLNNNKIDQAITLILAELNKIKVSGVSDKELEDAKDFIEGKLVLELEDSENVASWYARQELLTRIILTPAERLAIINQVKVDDIKRVADDIINQKKLNLALIGPFKDGGRFKKLLTF